MELKYPLKRQKRKKIKNAVDFLINFQINILFLYSIIIIKTTSCLFIKGINIYIKINNCDKLQNGPKFFFEVVFQNIIKCHKNF
jgi:hypothetical protein